MSYWACVRAACKLSETTGQPCYVVTVPSSTALGPRYLALTNEDVITSLVRVMGARVLLSTSGGDRQGRTR